MKKKWFKISYILLLIIVVISVSLNIRVGTLNPRFAVFADYGREDNGVVTFLGHGYVPFVSLPYPYTKNEEIDEENYLHWSETNSILYDVLMRVSKVYLYNNDPNHILLYFDKELSYLGTDGDFYRADFPLPNRKDNEITNIVVSVVLDEDEQEQPEENIYIKDPETIQKILASVQEGKEVLFDIKEVIKELKPNEYYCMYIEYKDYPIIEILGNITTENGKSSVEWAEKTAQDKEEIRFWPQDKNTCS